MLKKSVEGGGVLPKTGNFEFNFNVNKFYMLQKSGLGTIPS